LQKIVTFFDLIFPRAPNTKVKKTLTGKVAKNRDLLFANPHSSAFLDFGIGGAGVNQKGHDFLQRPKGNYT